MIRKVLTVCLCVAPIALFSITQAESTSPSGSSSPGSPSRSLESSSMSDTAQTSGQSQMTQVDPLIGQKVLDSQQKELGQIQDVIVDTQGHKAKYAVLGSGGFLGIGEDYHAVPWSSLNIQGSGDTIQSVNINTDADTIKNSPVVQMGSQFDSRTQSQIDSYYHGKGLQTNGMSDGMSDQSSMSNGVSGQSQIGSQSDGLYQPETSGTRPSGLTGTSTDRQFNTAEPRRDSVYEQTDGTNGTYGDGVRSGEDSSLNTEPNQTSSQTSPFGSYNGTSDSSSSDSMSRSSGTSTKYRSGYSEGVNRSPQSNDSAMSTQSSNGQNIQSGSSQFVFYSDLSGRSVKSGQDEKVGTLKDLVVDSKKGDIRFGLISMDDGMVAVPWNALHPSGQDAYTISTDKETLRSLAFQSDSKPDFNDPAYQQNVYQRFGQQPPTVYGYVTPESGSSMSGMHPEETEYTQKFDAQNLETVSGKITEIKTDQSQMKDSSQSEGMSQSQQKAMHLKIETDQGQKLAVHAAPEQFLKQRNLELKKGDTIRVTGTRAQVKGEDVLIASRISKNGQEVMIRSTDGKPMWQSSQSGTQQQSGSQSGSSSSPMSGSSSSTGSSMNGMSGSSGSSSSNGMSGSSSGAGSSGLSAGEITGGSSSAAVGGASGSGSSSSATDSMGKMTNGTTDAQSLQFKAEDQTSLSGTVQSTDTGAGGPLATMSDAVIFKVQTDQGQTSTVYAGPRNYLQEQNMTFSSGDTIKATGWKKTINGQEVFIASKIEKNGQTLQLRDSQGSPKWKQDSSGSGQMDSQRRPTQTDGSLNSKTNTTY